MRVLGMGYTPEPIAPITVSSVWTGPTGIVKARSVDAAAMTMRYSTHPDLDGYSTVVGVEGNDDVFRFAPALLPFTEYFAALAGSDVTFRFRSPPTPGDPTSFALWAASCAGHSGGEYVTDDVSNAPTFDVIAAKLLAGTLIGGFHLGDRHYRDISSESDALFRAANNDVMAASRQLAMHKAGWMDYTPDDHDAGPNDSHAGSASIPAMQRVYREHVPHPTLAAADSINHTYVYGRVRVIHLDVRSYRSQNSATDNSSKTALGSVQKEWLLDTTNEAEEPLIVLNTVMPWNGTGSISFGSFSTERDELIAAWTAQAKKDRMVIIHGDNHFLAGDDGTNAPGGIPTFNLAALDAGYTSDDGTWSTGIIKQEQQQYGTLTFDDDGDEITLTVRGYSVNSSSVETERFEVVLGPY